MKKVIVYLLFAIVVLVCSGFAACMIQSIRSETRLLEHATEARAYCERNHLSTDYCFLVDFDIHSGKERFFVWEFHRNKVVYSTICAHGRGGNSTLMQVDFSNAHGSGCSSIGRYKVGAARHMYNHPQVPCLEVWGLDSTCSNAHNRGILIHPSLAQFPTWPIPMLHRTQGCFGLSLRGFQKVKQFKSQTSQPILLWAYK